MSTDFKSLGKYEQGALISGAVAIVLSFFSAYIKASFKGNDSIPGLKNFSTGTNAWTSYATLGMILILAAVVIVAVKAFAASSLPEGVPWTLAALATAGLGTILIILRALTAGESRMGVSVGPGWSGWLLFIAAIALTACTALMFKESGEKLPEIKK